MQNIFLGCLKISMRNKFHEIHDMTEYRNNAFLLVFPKLWEKKKKNPVETTKGLLEYK